MFTMNQVEVWVESIKLASIFGFLFFLVQMFMSHSLKMKDNLDDSKSTYYALRRRLTLGLGLLCICFVMILMLMNSLNNGFGYSQHDVLITSDPHLMKEAMNKVLDTFKLLVIFCFVSLGIRMVLSYREQINRLKNDSHRTIDVRREN